MSQTLIEQSLEQLAINFLSLLMTTQVTLFLCPTKTAISYQGSKFQSFTNLSEEPDTMNYPS